MDYALEKFADIQPEVEAMAPLQWAEMAKGFERFVPKPRVDIYLEAEKRGKTILVTARKKGNLVGYFGMLIHPSMSAGNALTATSTPYFVMPTKARGVVLLHLIRRAIDEARARGAKIIAIKTHPWASAGPLLQRMRFQETETWFTLDVTGDAHA